MPVLLSFTPWQALLGGLSLGTVSAAKTLISGRILGISGAIKGLTTCDYSTWRWLFLGGMAGGAALVAAYMPWALETLPASYTVQRAAAAGLMVGVGSSLGNGCTSGHGIAGNARLSVRSLVYTLTFMVTGAAAATLTGTMDSLGVAPVRPAATALSSSLLHAGGTILAAATAGTAVLAAAAAKWRSKRVSMFYEAFAGVIFSLGLGFSKMTRPSEVASFLAVTHPAWNLTLMFVMGGALLVALPATQLLIVKRKKTLDGSAMTLPSNNTIDAQLMVGGVLFGGGWGVGGMCPGPALVALGNPQVQTVTMVASMVAGMWLGGKLTPYFQRRTLKSA